MESLSDLPSTMKKKNAWSQQTHSTASSMVIQVGGHTVLNNKWESIPCSTSFHRGLISCARMIGSDILECRRELAGVCVRKSWNGGFSISYKPQNPRTAQISCPLVVFFLSSSLSSVPPGAMRNRRHFNKKEGRGN